MAEVSVEEIDKAGNVPGELVESPKEKENEYLKVVNKKIRPLLKKLNIKIANIEKKVASNSPINEDEQKVLANKSNVVKSLKELEDLKAQMVKIYNEVRDQ
jgi:hypothetical protein